MFSFFKRTKSKSSEPDKKNKDKTLTKSVSLPPTLTPSPQDAGIKNKSKASVTESVSVTQDSTSVGTPVTNVAFAFVNASGESISETISETDEVIPNDLPKENVTTDLQPYLAQPLAVEEMAPGKISAACAPFNQTVSYANVVKKPDPPENKQPPPRSVKPCSHATLAATPRAIVYGTKKENICTPPGSPTFPLKKRSASDASVKDTVDSKVVGKSRDSNLNLNGVVKINAVDSLKNIVNCNNNNEVVGAKKGCNSSARLYDAELDKYETLSILLLTVK